MNTLIQERNNHNETCITVKVSRRSQKVVIILANDSSGLAFCSTDLGHIFGNNVGNQFGVLMKGKGPHEPQFAYDIVRIHSLMIYSDLVEYSIVGDTKAPLLRCFPFISKLKGGDIITTAQYMNYQTFSNLQFRPLLKNSFHSIHIDLRNTSAENILEFAVPKIAEVVSGRKNFKTAAKIVGKKTLRKQLGEGEGQGSCRRTGMQGGRERKRKGVADVREAGKQKTEENHSNKIY